MSTGRISMLFCSKVAVSTSHEKLENIRKLLFAI
jgi:hypothetical protein